MIRFFKKICLLLILLPMVSAVLFLYWLQQPMSASNSDQAIMVVVAEGSHAKEVANTLYAAGVPIHPWAFRVLVRGLDYQRQLKSGAYRFPLSWTPWQVLQQLTKAPNAYASIAIVEGMTFHQLRRLVASHEQLKHDTQSWTDTQLLQALNMQFTQAEGLFLPDTYLFIPGISDLEVYQQAHAAMMRYLEKVWAQRQVSLPLKTPYEALILASIIEKETGITSDRPLIASVFINRLKINMPLQTDPTIIYGMGERFAGNLRKADLLHDQPYNTYLRRGLPPTPIALPGKASIFAAVQPEKTDFLYFVARGDGSSQFSNNLHSHEQAVDFYQRKLQNR